MLDAKLLSAYVQEHAVFIYLFAFSFILTNVTMFNI